MIIIDQTRLANILSHTRICMCDYGRVFWIIGFIDYLQVVTTNNYNTIVDFHTLQITTAFFPACAVFIRHFLVTDSNNGYSSFSVFKSRTELTKLQTSSRL
jgi:hypothetical protein